RNVTASENEETAILVVKRERTVLPCGCPSGMSDLRPSGLSHSVSELPKPREEIQVLVVRKECFVKETNPFEGGTTDEQARPRGLGEAVAGTDEPSTVPRLKSVVVDEYWPGRGKLGIP